MSASATRRRSTNGDVSDSLGHYLNEIAGYPLLTREEEIALSRRIQAGDRAAVDQLVCGNLRFVVAIAKRYRHQGVPMVDLINEGNIGLMRAAEKYDCDKGVKFISYAVWWIRQSIVQAVAENAHSVRVPVRRAGAVYRLGRRVNALRQTLGREPTSHEVAAELHIDPSDVDASLSVTYSAVSLDTAASEGSELLLADLLADETMGAADDSATDTGMSAMVQRAIGALRPREARILRLYFGFGGAEPMTLEDIGHELGVTRERVRQLKDRALTRIRRSSLAPALESFT